MKTSPEAKKEVLFGITFFLIIPFDPKKNRVCVCVGKFFFHHRCFIDLLYYHNKNGVSTCTNK